MNVKKSYEFLAVGGKIVVRRMEAPDYEFKTILTADALVEEKRVAGADAQVFVLRAGNGWYLCFDADDYLSVSPFCTEYLLDDDCVLYYADKWYWHDMGKGSVALGQRVHDLSFLWLDKTDSLVILNWFAGGALQQKMCKSCEVLPGYGIRELPVDLLKITTENGDFFVSVRERLLPNNSPCFMGRKDFCPVITKTEVLFRKESMAAKVEFYKFAKAFCEKLLKAGLGRIVDLYDEALLQNFYEENENDCIVTYFAGLSSLFCHDVTIDVNLSKIFRQEKGAYVVRCEDVFYKKTADDIEFVHDEDERALLVEIGDELDKLSAGAAEFRINKLYLQENI